MADPNIVILNSRIIDSSFALGMIYMPPLNFFNPSQHDIIYRYQNNMKAKFAQDEARLAEFIQ